VVDKWIYLGGFCVIVLVVDLCWWIYIGGLVAGFMLVDLCWWI